MCAFALAFITTSRKCSFPFCKVSVGENPMNVYFAGMGVSALGLDGEGKWDKDVLIDDGALLGCLAGDRTGDQLFTVFERRLWNFSCGSHVGEKPVFVYKWVQFCSGVGRMRIDQPDSKVVWCVGVEGGNAPVTGVLWSLGVDRGNAPVIGISGWLCLNGNGEISSTDEALRLSKYPLTQAGRDDTKRSKILTAPRKALPSIWKVCRFLWRLYHNQYRFYSPFWTTTCRWSCWRRWWSYSHIFKVPSVLTGQRNLAIFLQFLVKHLPESSQTIGLVVSCWLYTLYTL